MSENKFTPGPWTLLSVFNHWIEYRGQTICMVDSELQNAEANAKLISVAPELLDVAEALIEWIDAVPDDVELPTMPGVDRDWVNFVIAKAKGLE